MFGGNGAYTHLHARRQLVMALYYYIFIRNNTAFYYNVVLKFGAYFAEALLW